GAIVAGTAPVTLTRLEFCSRKVFTYRAAVASVERLRNCSVVPAALSRTVRLKTLLVASPATGSMCAHSESPHVPSLAAARDSVSVVLEAVPPGSDLSDFPAVAVDGAPPPPTMRTISASPPPFWKNW